MAKKRANGEGSIRKRKDGRWEGRYTAGHDPETGKPIYKNVLGRTQAEVKEKLKTAIQETQSLDFSKTGQYTVGRWMDVWYENYAKIKVRPSSHQTYKGYIENHIKPNIGDIPLEKLTTLDLQRLYKTLLANGRVDRLESKGQPKGLSPKTVRNIHQILSSALKLAQEQRIILTNPAEGCALPKVEHREMKTLPVEQLQSFLREAKDSGVFELYYLELATGLRRGELLGLKWEDIDLEHGDLRVRRQIARINGKVVEAPLKTKNAYRTLPLAEDTISIMGLPVGHRRPHLTGQCAPHAPPGAETGGVARGSVPRFETYLRYTGPAKRCGHQNRVRHAGALQRRVHSGHLRPCDHLGPEGGGQHYGETPLRQRLTRSKSFRPFPLHFPVWVRVWVSRKSSKMKSPKKYTKAK